MSLASPECIQICHCLSFSSRLLSQTFSNNFKGKTHTKRHKSNDELSAKYLKNLQNTILFKITSMHEVRIS